MAVDAHGEVTRTERDVTLSWEPVEGAKSYEVNFEEWVGGGWGSSGLATAKVEGTDYRTTLKAGRYRLKLRALDKRGVPGPWGEGDEFKVPTMGPVGVAPLKDTVVALGEGSLNKTRFEWRPVERAAEYETVVLDADGKEVARGRSTTTNLELKLPSWGFYTWRVAGITAAGDMGRSSRDWGPFKVVGPPLDRPEPKAVGGDFAKEITWAPIRDAEWYTVKVFSRPIGALTYREIAKPIRLSAARLRMGGRWLPGHYRMEVRAESTLRLPSPVVEFNWPLGDRAREMSLAKIEQISGGGGHLWIGASGTVAGLRYQMTSRETNAAADFTTIVGGGDAEVGFFKPQSHLGALVGVESQTLSVLGTKHVILSAPVLGLWRWSPRTWLTTITGAGLSYHRQPLIKGSFVGDTWEQETLSYLLISVYGDARLALAGGITARLALRLDRWPHDTDGIKSGNKLTLAAQWDPTPSVQAFAGVSYSSRQLTWDSSTSDLSMAIAGDQETVQMSSTGLEVGLEWNLW
jgi:hypothetical protein